MIVAIQYVEPNASKRIEELLQHHQVQMARLKSEIAKSRSYTNYTRDNHLYDIAKLRAYINSLYGYARGEDRFGPQGALSRQEMLSALNQVHGFDQGVLAVEGFPEVAKKIEKRHSEQVEAQAQ